MTCNLLSFAQRTHVAILFALFFVTVVAIPQVRVSDFEMADRAARVTALHAYFDLSADDGAVDEALLQLFLNEFAAVHYQPDAAADGRAAAIVANGYTSKHDVAGITKDELVGMGFLTGNAKRLATYLGGDGMAPAVAAPLGQPADAVSQAQSNAQLGAAVAMAVTSAQKVIALCDGSSSRPTVGAVIKWLKKHRDKVNTTGFPLLRVIQLLMDDFDLELAPHIIADPALTADAAYVREVIASLTPEQYEKYGDNEQTSAMKLIQNVLRNVADMKVELYVHYVGEFVAFETPADESAVKGKFFQFNAKLNEVRYHKMFALKQGMEKLVSVIRSKPFLMAEVLAMWNASPKDQTSFSAVLKHVRNDVDVPATPGEGKSSAQNKQKQRQQDGSKRPWSNNRTPGSGKSQSNQHQGGQRNQSGGSNQSGGNNQRPWQSRRPYNGSSNSDANKGNATAQVNHLRAVAEARRQIEEDMVDVAQQHERQSDDRLDRIADQLENFITASTINMISAGDVFCDCRQHAAFGATDDVFYDCTAGSADSTVAAVMQVQTRSTKQQKPRAPTEMERLRRAADMAKVTSACTLDKGPVIDSATDTDVIGNDSVACATNVQSCKPFEFETISGGGVSNTRADLSTPLVELTAAPIVKSSRTSIVSTDTIHSQGYAIVSDSTGMTLQKDGIAYEAVPDGNMHRLPVVDSGKIDAEINHAIALHRKTVMARTLRKMILHRKRGHRPADPDGCDGCGLQLTRKPARRLKPDAQRRAESRGHVGGIDYITGLPPDNDGNTAVIGLVIASREKGQSVGWYKPVKSHSGEDAIEAFKECEFRVSMMFPPGEFKLARVHSDCEPSLIGPLADYLKSKGVWPTRTEGYDHNGNAIVENRNRTMMKGLRTVLYTATCGRSRYNEVWGTAVVHINDCVNHTSHAGESSPVENCGGEPIDLESDEFGVYGSLVRFYRAKERRDGKLDSTCCFGAYAGRSHDVPGGHRVIELSWNHDSKRFDLLPTVDVKTVSIDNTKYPLSTLPVAGSDADSFDDFIDMFDPRSERVDVYEVQKIVDHRFVTTPGSRVKSIEYLVHWKGFHQRDSTWEPDHNLINCGAASIARKYRQVNIPKVYHITTLDPDYLATHEIMQRHKLSVPFDKCLTAYKLEFGTVCKLRMTELFGSERERVIREEKAPRLRMNPEPKDDGRLKMRLLVMGHLEPHEWTSNMNLDSPTPAASSVKMMAAMSDETEEEEEMSIGDVATAFLKGDEYTDTDRPRYVVYREYRGSKLRVFKLRGSLYGQRDAPVRWFATFSRWLVGKGFVQCKNDVCLFRHPVTRVKVLLWVDDILARGVRRHTDVLWNEVDEKFGLKHREYLKCGVSRTFIGVSMLKSRLNGETVYCMDQNADMRAFLMDTPVAGVPLKSPMRDRNDLYVNDTPANKADSTWFRSKQLTYELFVLCMLDSTRHSLHSQQACTEDVGSHCVCHR